jgi:endonuclease/exonuclease/phosphatase family metal-dependent hydrolase
VSHVLHEIGADIAALQEVGGDSLIDEMQQFRFFEKHLGMQAVAALRPRWGHFEFGNAIFARGEVVDVKIINLTVLPFEKRGAIDCLIRLAGNHLVRVIATHLGLFPHERRRQVQVIAELLEMRRQPLTVLLGDFNIFGWERRILRRIGAPVAMPKLRTFPSRRPLMSLDRVWAIPNDRVVHTHVHRTPLSRLASDHLPIVADVSLPGRRHDTVERTFLRATV